jgi:hypothetical protein
MKNELKLIPMKVIEVWYKERLATTIANFKELGLPNEVTDDFLNGAWNASRVYLETELEGFQKAISELNAGLDEAEDLIKEETTVCPKCGHMEFK